MCAYKKTFKDVLFFIELWVKGYKEAAAKEAPFHTWECSSRYTKAFVAGAWDAAKGVPMKFNPYKRSGASWPFVDAYEDGHRWGRDEAERYFRAVKV